MCFLSHVSNDRLQVALTLLVLGEVDLMSRANFLTTTRALIPSQMWIQLPASRQEPLLSRALQARPTGRILFCLMCCPHCPRPFQAVGLHSCPIPPFLRKFLVEASSSASAIATHTIVACGKPILSLSSVDFCVMVEVISLSRAFEITSGNTITVITARVSTPLVFGVAGC